MKYATISVLLKWYRIRDSSECKCCE